MTILEGTQKAKHILNHILVPVELEQIITKPIVAAVRILDGMEAALLKMEMEEEEEKENENNQVFGAEAQPGANNDRHGNGQQRGNAAVSAAGNCGGANCHAANDSAGRDGGRAGDH